MLLIDDIKEHFRKYVDHTVLCPFCGKETLVKNENSNRSSGIPVYWCFDCGWSTMISLLDNEAIMRTCVIYYKTLEYDIKKLRQDLQEKENRLNKARKEIVSRVVADEL